MPDPATQAAAAPPVPTLGIDLDWSAVRGSILQWYAKGGRWLPFRATSDPYAILVSEAMAQQTQAERAGEAWVGFMAAYPTPAALAAATPADVLRAWRGLGYNRRALNLWRAARRIVEVHEGRVPADLVELERLPGVGPYTARAVAAIAFGVPIGAVDTNVRRVLGRIAWGAAGNTGSADLQRLADAVVPTDRPAAWTHALMDLGATVCRARNPACEGCPALAWCRYAAEPQRAGGEGGPRSSGETRAPSRGTRPGETSFPSTSRWLRGRVIDRLRTAPGSEWLVIDGPIGTHSPAAVAAALDALAGEGLVELASVDGTGVGATGRRARLAVG